VKLAWTAGNGGGLCLGTLPVAGSVEDLYAIWGAGPGLDFGSVTTGAGMGSMPPGYTSYRLLGSYILDGSANLLGFQQYGDEFLFAAGALYSGTANAASAIITLSVPMGRKVWVQLESFFGSADTYLSSPDQADEACTGSVYTDIGNAPGVPFRLRTNTSGQLRIRASVNGNAYQFRCVGWFDPRGRDQ
jgi:hypothetical protein